MRKGRGREREKQTDRDTHTHRYGLLKSCGFGMSEHLKS